MIVVVDYQKGNLKSVERGLLVAGARDVVISADAEVIARADAIVLPGVGAFAEAAETMEELGQMAVIRARVNEGVPFLGICLGMHLMFEEGVEGAPAEDDELSSNNALGLAILPGVVDALPRLNEAGEAFKLPHVGWNSVDYQPGCPLFDGIAQGEYFYFTHSYASPETPATVATTTHATAFPSVVQFRDAAFGVQFHPEKSSEAGMAMLRNFVKLAKEA